jgi:hypothetical protein
MTAKFMHSLLLLLLCAVTLFADNTAEPAGPAKDVPELAALSHYAGDWDVTFHNSDLRGVAKGEWVLEGRFLRQTWKITAGQAAEHTHGMTMMTFDTQKKTYRMWAFVSNGSSTNESRGAWDEKTKTMTSKFIDPETGNTWLTTAKFNEPGQENWQIVIQDKAGKTLGEVSGRNQRTEAGK